jgi:hypothetical protein
MFFQLPWVSYLFYPNLRGTKRLGCCCCCIVFAFSMELAKTFDYFSVHDFFLAVHRIVLRQHGALTNLFTKS